MLERFGFRGRLFLISVGIIGLGGAASGLWLEGRLAGSMREQREMDLQHQAQLLAEAAQVRPPEEMDALADRVSRSTGTRVTLLDASGRVLGDSHLDQAQLPAAENHRDRPEIAQALAGGAGAARRGSASVGVELLYVAVAWPAGGPPAGVARVALPTAEVEEDLARLRLLLLLAGLGGLVMAGVMSALASHWMTSGVRDLVAQARRLGQSGGRLVAREPGELSGLVGSFNQLSEELERTVRDLAAERERFEAVLEGMGEAVLALDGERRITLMNPAATRLFARGELAVGRPLVELIRDGGVHAAAAEALRGATGSAEFDLPSSPHSGAPPLRILATVSPLKGRGCVLACRDVTELRRLERVRRDFVANVSHELRTPVTVIRVNAETLLNGALEDPDHAGRFVEAVLRSAQRLSRLIDDLLDLSRLDAGREPLQLAPRRPGPLVRRSVQALLPRAEQRQQRIEEDLPEDLVAICDPRAVDSAVTNLIENAIKYCPPGSRIRVRLRAEPERVVIEVEDDGPGVAEHHRERLFERFYRVDPGRSRDMGGTGLGLAIVKHLAEAMGGEVGVAPAQPRGSIFWFSLPLPGEEHLF